MPKKLAKSTAHGGNGRSHIGMRGRVEVAVFRPSPRTVLVKSTVHGGNNRSHIHARGRVEVVVSGSSTMKDKD